jgi:pimeloyl-ACP methyl ester carboxylesterase
MGLTSGFTLRRLGRVPDDQVDGVLAHFDHGTQRAILRLYRSAPEDVLAEAGRNLGAIKAPALVVWGDKDPYLPTEFAHRYADALGGPATVDVVPDAGHWPWFEDPAVIDRVAAFLAG